MEPPIQGLNRRSMVLLLAMSFRRMLYGNGEEGVKGLGDSSEFAEVPEQPSF